MSRLLRFTRFKNELKRALRIGVFLAFRQIRRGSKWTTALIIFVMALTFLNLTVVSGILVGLIEGSVEANKNHYTSDLIVSTLPEKRYIENSQAIIRTLESMPEVDAFSPRYLQSSSLEANYKTRTNEADKANTAGGLAVGIDPIAEDALTELSSFIVEGEYLKPDDYDSVLLGAYLLKKYLPIDSPGFTALENVGPGTKIRVKIGDVTREVTVKGILRSKVDEVTTRVYFVDNQLKSIIARADPNVNEIAIRLKPGAKPERVQNTLLALGYGEYAKIQTFEDAQPKFLKDIKATFALLGNMISSIGLVVACITIFIVIFINAITRRKFIGILKGIGIDGFAIECAYVIQSLFYAGAGTLVGCIILFGFLKPFITAHPIDFPFSDGILVAEALGTTIRILTLFIATLIAGYIPARIVVKQNTLDAILGR